MELSDTSNLLAGMELTCSGLNTGRVNTFVASSSTVDITTHGIPNGTMLRFTTITTTTGVVLNTLYYVINSTLNNFQVSATLNGSALTLSNNGSGVFVVYPKIVSINTNVSIITDIPASVTSGFNTLTASVLKRSLAYLKGWTVTG